MPRSTLVRFASLCLLIVAAPAAATTLDFEDLGANLPIQNPRTGQSELYYDGSSEPDGAETDFASQGATFANSFSDFGGGCCWNGWAYSQTTDTTTPGFGNQHSAFAGSGVGGSATYGVAYTGGGPAQGDVSRITFDGPVNAFGAFFTNTTYAALSMRDGDGFAKQFGGPSGDDPDRFWLTISGRDASDAETGSVVFDLADYRFADNGLDYIVSDWTWVDLSALGTVHALEFVLQSTDTGDFGLNTPSYFALDGLVVPEPGTGMLLAAGLVGLAWRRRP